MPVCNPNPTCLLRVRVRVSVRVRVPARSITHIPYIVLRGELRLADDRKSQKVNLAHFGMKDAPQQHHAAPTEAALETHYCVLGSSRPRRALRRTHLLRDLCCGETRALAGAVLATGAWSTALAPGSCHLSECLVSAAAEIPAKWL